MTQEAIGGRAAPLRVAGRKVAADVARTRGAEDGVDQRVDGDVGIAVAGQAVAVFDAQAAQPQFFALLKPVDVEPGADADRWQGGCSALREVAGVRDLCKASSPSTSATATPAARATCASSPAVGAPDQLRCAARIDAKRNAWGVCTRRKVSRSAIPAMKPLSATSMLSATGSTGMAAPCSSSASSSRWITASVTPGRAASWISTRADASSASASSPLRTDCWRCSPPTTNRPAIPIAPCRRHRVPHQG